VKLTKFEKDEKKIRKSPSSSFSSFDEEFQPTVRDERRPMQAFGAQKDGFTTDSTIDGFQTSRIKEDNLANHDDNVDTEDDETTQNVNAFCSTFCIR